MDSVTQIALGGAVGYAVLGSKIGRKAILYGAVLGTLPDLDVLIPYAGDVEAFTYHRGFSHSLWVHLLISPVFAWLFSKLHASANASKMRWFSFTFLILSTHALLDACTVYGTQLMWPLTEYPFGLSNIFIIDPLYTLPLLFGIGFALFAKIPSTNAKRANAMGLALSSLYIVWSIIAKVYVDHKVELAMQSRGIEVGAYVSTPAPFTTLLWRSVAMVPSTPNPHYYEIYTSVFDAPENISFHMYPTQVELLSSIEDKWALQRLRWFTKGLYSVTNEENKIILSDLRMGVECSYVFNFEVGENSPNGVVAGSFTRISRRPDMAVASAIWDRIWDSTVALSPSLPCR